MVSGHTGHAGQMQDMQDEGHARSMQEDAGHAEACPSGVLRRDVLLHVLFCWQLK